jgi:CubicO group peptidase (beta-lactamase class C family)
MPTNFASFATPQDPYVDYGTEALLGAVAEARDRQPLGSQYAYSNCGMGLLGWLLGEQAGNGYGLALRTAVLDPLKLQDTGLVPGDNEAQAWSQGQGVPAWNFDNMPGAGWLWSTTADLMQLAAVLAQRP